MGVSQWESDTKWNYNISRLNVSCVAFNIYSNVFLEDYVQTVICAKPFTTKLIPEMPKLNHFTLRPNTEQKLGGRLYFSTLPCCSRSGDRGGITDCCELLTFYLYFPGTCHFFCNVYKQILRSLAGYLHT